jgi:hypothetical protein
MSQATFNKNKKKYVFLRMLIIFPWHLIPKVRIKKAFPIPLWRSIEEVG